MLRLQNYAGRLHRKYHKKKEVRIYDYLDTEVPVLLRMYRRRLKTYKSMGHTGINELQGRYG
jgi:superfamily II DNA or RNA helicase